MTFGESLKRFRSSLGLNQKEFANQLNMKPPLYQRYESGKTVPSVNFVIRLSNEYGVSTDYLLGLSDEPRPPKLDEKTLNLVRAVQAFHTPAQPSQGAAQ